MNKQYLILLLSLLVIAQLGVAGRMVFQQEKIIQKGQQFFFKAAPVDPHDPFRGKYMTLRFEAEQYESTDTTNWQRKEEVYVLLTTDVDGFAKILDLSTSPPGDDQPYFKATINYSHTQESLTYVELLFPFNRYYMEESKAPEAEKIYREALQQNKENIYAVVFINQGKSVLEDVRIGDNSIKNLVDTSSAK